MQCCSAVRARKTRPLNGREGGGVWVALFSEVTPFKDNVSTWSQVNLSLKYLTKVLCLPHTQTSSPSMKISTQRKAGRGMWARQRFPSHFSPSQSPLRLVTSHSRVTRVSRLPLCEKRSAWGGDSTWCYTLNNDTQHVHLFLDNRIDLLPRNSHEKYWVHFRKKLL